MEMTHKRGRAFYSLCGRQSGTAICDANGVLAATVAGCGSESGCPAAVVLLPLLLLAALPLAGAAPRITACDLGDPRLDHSFVVISTRVVFTMHESGTVPDVGCRGRGKKAWAVLDYPETANPAVGFSIEPGSEEMLRPYYRLQGGASRACVTLEGQLFVRRDFHLKRVGSVIWGNGFGEAGRARSALVVKRVISASPCEPSP